MWGRTCIPRKVYQVLFPFKRYFRCAQAQALSGLLLVGGGVDPRSGQGHAEGARDVSASKLKYWTTLRMVRSGQWDAQGLMTAMAATTLRTLRHRFDGRAVSDR